MKFDVMGTSDTKTRRAPQGARGLKFVVNEVWHRADEMSRPARGAWVEILPVASMGLLLIVAPRKGRVG